MTSDKSATGEPVLPPASSARRAPRVKRKYAVAIGLIHLVAALAFFPWFFSWTGVVAAALGIYVFGVLGINIGYHRLLAHRSFACPRWLERLFVVLAVCCWQDSPAKWVATHRQHHHASDKERDPHSPLASFLWGHMGWLMIENDNAESGPLLGRYAADVMRDPFYRRLQARDNWAKVAFLSWAAFFAAGFIAEALAGGSTLEAFQFGASLLVWGGAVRTVAEWHATWSVNSVTHLWGYRNYDTPDNSRNNLLIGLIAHGEGWHNNHHADPGAARHGDDWREPDLTWATIRGLTALGLAWDVAPPSPRRAAAVKARRGRA